MTEAATPNKKALCPECNGQRVCDLYGEKKDTWEWESDDGHHSVNGGATHCLLQCRGCETVFYWRSSWDSEDLDYSYGPDGETRVRANPTIVTFPVPAANNRPPWLSSIGHTDRQLAAILMEVYQALEQQTLILAAVGLRTALDRATEVLGIDTDMTFERKLQELQSGGWIGETERMVLEVVVDAGSAAAHRGWNPTPDEMAQLVSAMEIFLQKAFVTGKKALDVKASIPAKPKKARVPKAAPPAMK